MSTFLWSSAASLFNADGFYPKLLDTLFFERWEGSLLSRDVFEAFTVWLSIALSLGAAGLLLLEHRARKLGHAYPERKARRIGIVLTVVGFLLYFDFFNPNTRYSNYYHRHELYHYYLGSKFFTEVG